MTDPQKWIEHLLNLGFSIQRHLHEVLIKGDDDLALPVGFESGDTIFEIDRHVEQLSNVRLMRGQAIGSRSF